METEFSISIDEMDIRIYTFIENKVAMETKFSVEENDYGKKFIFG